MLNPQTSFAEEQAEVEVLQGQIDKYDDLGKRLNNLQARLESHEQHATNAGDAVQVNTRQHQIVAENIDKLSRYVEKMLASGQDRAVEEGIIRAGPKAAGIDEYLAAMKRIDRALDRMTASKVRAQQMALGEYNGLLGKAVRQVQDLFQGELSNSTQPLEPLHYITKQIKFPILSPDLIGRLRSYEKALSTANARSLSYNQRENVAVRLYSEIRAPYMVTSLQSLAIASISTSKRKDPDEPYRKGTSAIGTYGTALEGMILAEYHNVSHIFSDEDRRLVLETTCQKALAELAKTLRELNTQIKSNLSTECFLAFELIDVVTVAGRKIGYTTADIKLPFSDILKPIRDTAKHALPALIEEQSQHVNQMLALPMDGAALPLTTQMMTRLQNLTLYSKPVASLLASLGDGNWGPSATSASLTPSNSLPPLRALDVGADGSTLLSHYVFDTIEAHLGALDGRVRALLKSKAVAGAFLSNTISVIDRMIRSSDLSSLLAINGNVASKLESWRKRGSSTYMDSWKDTNHALMDTTYTNRPGAASRPTSGNSPSSVEIIKNLNSKEKDSVKDRFKTFNSTFDEGIRRYKELAPAMERDVRSSLAREIGNVIEPMYTRFFDKYEAIDRGRGKYVRYDKGALAAALASLG